MTSSFQIGIQIFGNLPQSLANLLQSKLFYFFGALSSMLSVGLPEVVASNPAINGFSLTEWLTLLTDGRDRVRGDHAVGCHVKGLGLALMLAYIYACSSQL